MIKKIAIVLLAATFTIGAMAATSHADGQFYKVAKHKKHHKPAKPQK